MTAAAEVRHASLLQVARPGADEASSGKPTPSSTTTTTRTSTSRRRRRQPPRSCRTGGSSSSKPDPSPKHFLLLRAYARVGPKYQVASQRLKRPVVSAAAYRSERPSPPVLLSNTIPHCTAEQVQQAAAAAASKAPSLSTTTADNATVAVTATTTSTASLSLILGTNRAKPASASNGNGSLLGKKRVYTTKPMAKTTMRPPSMQRAKRRVTFRDPLVQEAADDKSGSPPAAVDGNATSSTNRTLNKPAALHPQVELRPINTSVQKPAAQAENNDPSFLSKKRKWQATTNTATRTSDSTAATATATSTPAPANKARRLEDTRDNDNAITATISTTTSSAPSATARTTTAPLTLHRKSYVDTVRRNRTVFTHDLIRHLETARQALHSSLQPLLVVLKKHVCKLIVWAELHRKVFLHADQSLMGLCGQKKRSQNEEESTTNPWKQVSKRLQDALNSLVQTELDLMETVLPQLDQVIACWKDTQSIASSTTTSSSTTTTTTTTTTVGPVTKRPIWMPALIQQLDETCELLQRINLDKLLTTDLRRNVRSSVQEFQSSSMMLVMCRHDKKPQHATVSSSPGTSSPYALPQQLLPPDAKTGADQQALQNLVQVEQTVKDKVAPLLNYFVVQGWIPTR